MLKGLTVAFVIAAALAVASAQEPIAIGIVRIDGHLMLIARITPQFFEAPPLATETIVNGEPLAPEAPIWPFAGIAWTLSQGGGRKPVDLTTIEPVMVRMPYCSDRLMWRTTLKRPPAPEGVSPIRKLGMAVRGAAIEQPEDVANQPDAASRRLSHHIVKLAHEKEALRLESQPKEYWPPNSYGDRAQAPVRIEQLRRYAAGGVTTYYFEAAKSWWKDSPDGLVTGWITDLAGTLRDQDVEYKFNNDRHKENASAKVWGIVRYQHRALWLLEWHGWEDEYYTVHDWPSGITRAMVNAYEC